MFCKSFTISCHVTNQILTGKFVCQQKKGSLKTWFSYQLLTSPAPLMLEVYFYTRSTAAPRTALVVFILTIFHLQINRHQCWVFTTLQHSGDDSMHQWELQYSMAPYALDGSLHGRHPPLDTPINLPIYQVWPLTLLFYSNFWKIIDMPWVKINNCHMRNKCIWRVYQWPRKRKMLFSFVPSSDTVRLGPLKGLLKLTRCRTLRTLNITSYVTSGTIGDTEDTVKCHFDGFKYSANCERAKQI